jgi:hypothetical protein
VEPGLILFLVSILLVLADNGPIRELLFMITRSAMNQLVNHQLQNKICQLNNFLNKFYPADHSKSYTSSTYRSKFQLLIGLNISYLALLKLVFRYLEALLRIENSAFFIFRLNVS